MRIGEYAQFCSTIQLNKAIPVLLEIRDNAKATPQILEEIKAVRKSTDLIHPINANTDAIPPVLGEIKGLRDDIRPGYANNLRQRTGRCPGDKGAPGHAVKKQQRLILR